MNTAVLCDFDDTVAQGNMAHLVLDRFGDGSWREVRRRYMEGSIPPEEYFERPFTEMRATREEMKAHVRENGRINDGFADLARYCQRKNIDIAIVSLGLDFYVQALLEQQQLDWVPIYAVGTRFTSKGIQFDFPHAIQDCGRWGICKCLVVQKYRDQGRRVVFVGDGRNDLCPARMADVVFARDQLVDLCRQDGVPYHELRDFNDVIIGLERQGHP
ncbi:MAG: MtnX-like HAD-IB family phosphatase [Dehalococcoidia bacterium]